MTEDEIQISVDAGVAVISIIRNGTEHVCSYRITDTYTIQQATEGALKRLEKLVAKQTVARDSA